MQCKYCNVKMFELPSGRLTCKSCGSTSIPCRVCWTQYEDVHSTLACPCVDTDFKNIKGEKSMNETTFENVRIGDKVYSLKHGWGAIEDIGAVQHAPEYLIRVVFNNGKYGTYTIDGFLYADDITPDLYWGEPQITAPPRPKKTVTKVLEGWVNVYGNIMCIHSTKEKADRISKHTPRQRLGEAVPFRHVYEVEEDEE